MRAALHALIDAGQEAGAPKLFTAIGLLTARDQNDEAGKILVLGAQSVQNPGAHRRIAEASITSLNQQLRRCMIKLISVHGFYEAYVIYMLFEMRQAVGKP